MREEHGSSECHMEARSLAFPSALLAKHKVPTSYWGSSMFVLWTRITPRRNLTQQLSFLWELSPLVPQEEYTCQQLWLPPHLLQRLDL